MGRYWTAWTWKEKEVDHSVCSWFSTYYDSCVRQRFIQTTQTVWNTLQSIALAGNPISNTTLAIYSFYCDSSVSGRLICACILMLLPIQPGNCSRKVVSGVVNFHLDKTFWLVTIFFDLVAFSLQEIISRNRLQEILTTPNEVKSVESIVGLFKKKGGCDIALTVQYCTYSTSITTSYVNRVSTLP